MAQVVCTGFNTGLVDEVFRLELPPLVVDPVMALAADHPSARHLRLAAGTLHWPRLVPLASSHTAFTGRRRRRLVALRAEPAPRRSPAPRARARLMSRAA